MIRGICDLRLTEEERHALTQQGFVSVDKRGEARYFKLRFRLRGTQRVCYLGNDPDVAERVCGELQLLQRRN